VNIVASRSTLNLNPVKENNKKPIMRLICMNVALLTRSLQLKSWELTSFLEAKRERERDRERKGISLALYQIFYKFENFDSFE
jgi:hypothetical protein